MGPVAVLMTVTAVGVVMIIMAAVVVPGLTMIVGDGITTTISPVRGAISITIVAAVASPTD